VSKVPLRQQNNYGQSLTFEKGFIPYNGKQGILLHCKGGTMAPAALKHQDTPGEEVSAAFMRNHRGAVCIAFADPVYVRAESIVVHPDTCAIHCILHENTHLLGHVSEVMIKAFLDNKEALLTALRPDGTVFELVAPVQVH
jgi:hypothetical protein